MLQILPVLLSLAAASNNAMQVRYIDPSLKPKSLCYSIDILYQKNTVFRDTIAVTLKHDDEVILACQKPSLYTCFAPNHVSARFDVRTKQAYVRLGRSFFVTFIVAASKAIHNLEDDQTLYTAKSSQCLEAEKSLQHV